ncbi:RelA/SpoT family protein [Crenobacter caeni]|uniref:GTP pyrophosphokinase n=1 Tax=Crenobacter caeni TaxID=2705474 RepID=A0A6B2KMZ7_9NEIS|nr:bifunctional (p)ppGpp synthetase/guanosine-3',5'-bis(diphosphate) 3'-pyrophosphohydrolase [Crenobacter caeni]NDV11606.1 bifunctional (p)ppGpp synthetase/guanosine-3',5'-bis(diphosphate) 3'-pyrophosphohydrolase [Crenobacter caeni]
MVSVVRPVADTLADAVDTAAWLDRLSASLPAAEGELLARAFAEAQTIYQDKTLPSTGEDVFSHAVGAAAIVADLDLLPDAIAATLLFAVPDYRDNGHEWLARTFNPTVAMLVEGVGKVRRLTELARLDRLATPEDRARQAETMRKMLLAMVTDIRVVLIKLAWRTQTMHYLPKVDDEALRRQIATETMDVFAPLANRLGVWQIKWELEDLGFRHQDPDSYKKIARLLDERRLERLDYIERVLDTLRSELARVGVHAEVAGRPKHIYSIWKKMRKKKLDFSELYDIRAVRILVDKLQDCYTALGIIHNMWQPIPGEFDDYISHPKANNYRSLHTAVIGPEDKAVEVQIRTFEMHEHAEFGVAAHWRYKEGGKGDSAYEEKISWLRQLLDWREEISSEREDLADAFKTELFADTIYVLTPQGRVLSLPAGATPIDFAYALHSDLGNRCRGAKVEGQIVPLSTPLANGQRVEILAAKEGGPSVNWLHEGWVKSSKAITKIRQYIRQQNADAIRETGHQLFERELARHPAHHPNQAALAEKLGFTRLDEVYAALGHGELSLRALAQAIESFAPPPPELAPEDLVKRSKGGHNAGGILIEGVDNLMTILAGCCKPAPPDAVVGFVTKGRGISIHRSNCLTLKRLSAEAPERLITADWGEQKNSVFPIDIEIIARDRASLLRDISDTLSREKLNVIAINSQTKDARARMRFTVEVRGVQEISRVIAHINEIQGVQEAYRC